MKIRKIQCLLMLMTLSLAAGAQNGINSPYSRYGFGILSDRSMGFNKGMGGVAQGFRDGSIINVANPASYSEVDSLTALFDLGITLQNANFKTGLLQQNTKNSSLDYAAFHFRATKNVGVAMGILPYSNIHYSMSSNKEPLPGNENITSSYSFTGDGGLHQAFIGTGWKFCKPLSIGANVSFLFGDYTNTTTMAFSDNTAYSIIRGYAANISTWMADFGVQYTQPISKTEKVVFGASYGLGHDIKNQAVRYTETLNPNNSAVEGITRDTIRNAFQLPYTISVGATYYKGNQIKIGADFELQKWSECKFPSQDANNIYTTNKNQLNDKIKFAIGGQYTPNPRSTDILKRSSYKIGGYYSQSYASADLAGLSNKKPYEFGLSAGISMPFLNMHTWYNSPILNLSVQWVHGNIPYAQNTTATPTIGKLTENYLKLCIGITFSERWFFKYKMQ